MSFDVLISKRLKPIKFSISEVEIWLFDSWNLNRKEEFLVISTLSEKEKECAQSYINLVSKHEFILGRFFLKYLISRKVNQDFKTLSFFYTDKGKPILKDFSGIHFNLSHSSGLGIIGISSEEIGVDIEKINKSFSIFDVIDTIFKPKEKKWILEKDTHKRFFQLWTIKEAFLKCNGIGITTDDFPELVQINENNWNYPGYSIVSGMLKNGKYSYAFCIKR